MASMYTDKSQLFVSAVQTVEQLPPPSLREILSAYRSKGEGDRDMLLAMLQAKTAEDQRIAETSALQRTIIETIKHDQPSTSPSLPPMNYTPPHSHYQNRLPTLSMSPNPPNPGDAHSHSRKRRSSRSPHHTYSPYARPPSRNSATPPIQMPPSPYSSSSNTDATLSPKRGNMPIASMLSSESKRSSIQGRPEEDSEESRGRR